MVLSLLMKKKCLINAKKGLKSALFGVIKIGFVLCTLYTPNFLIRRDLKITLLFTTVLDTNDMKLAISKSHFRKKNPKREIQFDQRKLMRFDWPVIKIIKLLTWKYWLVSEKIFKISQKIYLNFLA